MLVLGRQPTTKLEGVCVTALPHVSLAEENGSLHEVDMLRVICFFPITSVLGSAPSMHASLTLTRELNPWCKIRHIAPAGEGLVCRSKHLHAHRCRHAGWPAAGCARRPDARAHASFFGKLFGGSAHKDGPQLVPINPDEDGGVGGTSDTLFGPLVRARLRLTYSDLLLSSFKAGRPAQAVLLIGFLQHEVDSFRSMMLDMDADVVRMICCSRLMLRGSLQAALEVDAVPDYEQARIHSDWPCLLIACMALQSERGCAAQPPLGTRRAVILSGMSSAEVPLFSLQL